MLLGDLGKIADEEADAVLKTIRGILERARTLSRRLEDERQAARWRLYSRVSAWHKDHHPDQDISNCPVCGTDLEKVPSDALLDLSVKAALDQCREADSDIAKTAAEWERDEAAAFLNALPESLRGFADKTQRDTLLGICRRGYVDELLAHKTFSGRLEPLRQNGQTVWDIASGGHPLPEAPASENSALPDLFSSGKLQERLDAITRTLMLREHRLKATEALQSLMGRYIGKAKSAEESADAAESEPAGPAEHGSKPDEEPLREQIEAIRRAVQNAITDISAATMKQLEGRIVALTARSGSESFGYLKRLGQEIHDGTCIYENIGLNGQAVCISVRPASAAELVLERLWRVHGVLRARPTSR